MDEQEVLFLTEDRVVGRRLASNETFLLHTKIDDSSIILIRSITRHQELSSISLDAPVSDISLFSEKVNNVACATVKGRINVSHLSLRTAPSLSVKVDFQVIVDIRDRSHTAQPRVCWHSKNQEVLFVGWRSTIFKFNTKDLKSKMKRGKLVQFLTNQSMTGIVKIGDHSREITDLSTCGWMDLLVSSGLDGKVKVWSSDSTKGTALYQLEAHNGFPVGFASFMKPYPCCTRTILATRSLLNGEFGFWTSLTDGHWLLNTNEPSCLGKHSLLPPADTHYTQVSALRECDFLIVAYPENQVVHVVRIEEESESRVCRASCFALLFSNRGLKSDMHYGVATGIRFEDERIDIRQACKVNNKGTVNATLFELEVEEKRESIIGQSCPSSDIPPSAITPSSVIEDSGKSSMDGTHTDSSILSHFVQKRHTQLLAMQGEMGRQVDAMVTSAIGDSNALFAHFIEKSNCEQAGVMETCLKQITSLLETTVKNELNTLMRDFKAGIIPALEKAASSTLEEIQKRDIGEHGQTQMLTIEKHVQVPKDSLERTVVEAFKLSCDGLFDKMEKRLKKRLKKHFKARRSSLPSESDLESLQKQVMTQLNLAEQTSRELKRDYENLLQYAYGRDVISNEGWKVPTTGLPTTYPDVK